MSKLRNQMLVSQLLILASLFWGVWLYADFLCHHWLPGNGTLRYPGFQWLNNPHYQFNWSYLVVVVFMFLVGMYWQRDAKRAGFKWPKSTRYATNNHELGNLLALAAIGLAGTFFAGWLIDRNAWSWKDNLIETRFWTWSMWWSVTIGWLIVASVFCYVQSNRLRDPSHAAKLKELSPQERYKNVSTKDMALIRDELSLELARRGNDPSTDPEDLKIIHRSLAGRSLTSV
jgi:hypothetical protein